MSAVGDIPEFLTTKRTFVADLERVGIRLTRREGEVWSDKPPMWMLEAVRTAVKNARGRKLSTDPAYQKAKAAVDRWESNTRDAMTKTLKKLAKLLPAGTQVWVHVYSWKDRYPLRIRWQLQKHSYLTGRVDLFWLPEWVDQVEDAPHQVDCSFARYVLADGTAHVFPTNVLVNLTFRGNKLISVEPVVEQTEEQIS